MISKKKKLPTVKKFTTGNVISQPFNSYEWSRQIFSLQCQYNLRQTGDEKKEKYQLRDYKLIKYQILKIDTTRTVWQTVRRITTEILGVKGLIFVLILEKCPHEVTLPVNVVFIRCVVFFWVTYLLHLMPQHLFNVMCNPHKI